MLQGDATARLEERQLKMVTEAQKSCTRIVELINEMSEVSKLDGGAVSLAADGFDLFPLVADAAARMTEARDRGVALRVDGDEAGAPVTGDRGRLRAAFEAFMRMVLREQAGPNTVVAARRLIRGSKDASALVAIAPEAEIERTFAAEPAPFDERRGGLGLALPIARRVVERQGGRVWSPAVGTGDGGRGSVIVSLPLQEH
jgi:signal transduction histidine kinase